MSSGVRAKKAIIVLASVVVAGILLVFAFHDYPAPGQDSSVFLPPAIHLASGEGYVNGVHGFLYPAPLFPLIVSLLMWTATAHSALVVLGFFGAANVLLCALVFYRAATLGKPTLDWMDVLVIVLSLGGVASYFSYGDGRPEIFASLLVLGAILLALYWRATWNDLWLWAGLGGIIGIMGAAHPNGMLLFASLVGIYAAIRYRGGPLLYRLSCAYGIPVVVFGMVVLLSPYELGMSVAKIGRVAQYMAGPVFRLSQGYSLVDYYVLGTDSFFYGFIYLFALVAGGHLLFRHWGRIAAPWWTVVFLLVFLFLAYYTAIRTPNRNYNLLLLAPLFFAANLYYLGYFRNREFAYSRFVLGTYLAILIFTPLGFVRNGALFRSYVQHGMSLEEARSTVEELGVLDQSTSEVLVTKSMWTLTERYDRIFFCGHLRDCVDEADWLIIQQKHSGQTTPVEQIGEHELVHDSFVHERPRLFGIKLANSMRGYSFAVYARPQAESESDSIR